MKVPPWYVVFIIFNFTSSFLLRRQTYAQESQTKMELLDLDRNEEGSAYSKRRTSILKMPRKSSWSSEVQQPEHVVECVKPSDKRMSKRVSFAAANDVLLFSKDVKNTSASPTPLQELTHNATQQWIQMKTGEDEQFSACLPLQPNVLSDSNYGKSTNCINQEECLLSSAEQGENMDMTLSQTFNMFCDKDESTAFPFTNTHSAVYYDITDKENYFPKMKSVIKATDPLHCLFPQDIFTCPDKPNNKTTEMVFTREPSDNNQRLTMKPEPLSGDRSSSGLPLQPEPLCEDQTVCFTAHDAGMDMTQCQTTLISRDMLPSTNMQPKQEAVATLPALGVNLAFENFFASLSGQKNEVKTTLRSNVKLAAETQSSSRLSKRPPMGAQSCHVPRIQRPSVDVDAEQPPRERNEDLPRERTIRFAAEDLLHPVDSSVDLQQELPFSEKTTRFDDALMDVTQCLTVKIAEDCAAPLSDDSSILPKCGEKTSRFTCDEVTADKPIHLSTTINAEPQSILDEDSPRAEKTVQFTSEEGVMNKTRCLTLNLGVEMKASLSDLSPVRPSVTADVPAALKRRETLVFSNRRSRSLARHNSNTVLNVRREQPRREKTEDLPRERTMRFAAEVLLHPVDSSVDLQQELPFSEKTTWFNDALMDVTQCLTVNIAEDCAAPLSDDSSILPKCGENTSQFICDEATADNPIHHSTTINAEEGVMDKTRCITSNIGVEMKASLSDLSPVCTCVTADVPAALKRREPMVFSNQRSRSLNRHDANAVLNVRRSMPWGNPLPQETDDYSEVIHLNDGRGVLSVIEESIAEAKPKCENVDNSTTKASVQINTESGVGNEQTVVEPLAQSEVEIHQCSPQTHDEDQVVVDETEQSPASMRKGDKSGYSPKSRGAVLADFLSKMRRCSQQLMASNDDLADDNTLISPSDPELELGDGEAQQTFERDADFQKSKCKSSTTPFKLETKRLMSRLSVVGFMPKLGKRSQSEEAKTPNEPATAQMHTARFDLNVSDIKNEELGSYEDVSETLDSRSPDKEPEDMAVFGGFELDQELQDKIFEEEALVNEKKRPLEDEERTAEDEKRIRTSNDTVILDSQACTLVGDNITSAANTQTTISSICNHTVSLRCEGTLESSSMQSIYEYSLEDYANDIERKFEDGNITMLEFFKFFHMDFVIHNSRQSVAPGRVSSDVETSQMDVSRDRHIHAPRQQVYKADVRCLTEQVEGLKFRMRDLNKPLYMVNKALWEEMKNFTEGEFKSFSAKLKEIYSTCRKTSRAKAHEMKEGLYTDLLRANAEVQEKLRGSIQRADTMLNNLDDCMAKLEAELAALEGDVKRGQEELSTVTDAISDHERSASELQVQNMYSADKLRRVKEEAKDVDRRLTMLHRMNEWRLKEMTRTTSIYTFLYETLHLKLTYKDTEGNDERKIVDVSLKHLLDERSQGHARLVHALLSQVTQAQSWTKRYSSSKDVFDLLRELSLVVSRCRLLGEEVRLLDTWGSMSLDILDIHCVQTDVYITFSSLQRLQKFEVVFSVCLTNQLYTLQLKSFRNVMGDTTIQNIQEVLSSITPGHKYLTKTIKSIHERFLS